jgi:sialate O-acetylesterase
MYKRAVAVFLVTFVAVRQAWGSASPPTPGFAFGRATGDNIFANGMILQRDQGAKVWGTGASGPVTLKVVDAATGMLLAAGVQAAMTGSDWSATITATATHSAVLTATDASGATATLKDVAFGDVILCGGQSNMGFGMCGATSKTQTPAEAFDMVAKANIRLYFETGSGPNGGSGGGGCSTSVPGEKSITPAHKWLVVNRTNVGGASAVCILTANALAAANPSVPIGAVESCVGGTPVTDWTPPTGTLWLSFMKPLIPMTFKLALWDQGEADAKRTNSSYYSTEFPKMISLWRENFESTNLPFFYVELCTEYGAEEPKEGDFWYAQRSALKLPFTGFATTTDIERALHPPDKQDVAARLLLEIQRVAYAENVVSRGPELVSATAPSAGTLVLTFSNASMETHAGIFVGTDAECTKAQAAGSNNGAVVQFPALKSAAKMVAVPFTISGAKVSITCDPKGGPVHLNSDFSNCFLYGTISQLPAVPIEANCTASSQWEVPVKVGPDNSRVYNMP